LKYWLIAIFFLSSFAKADGFDPFIDYSEFEEATQEEADIHFFRNGRFLTLGLLGGLRGYTENYGSINDPGGSFGLFVAFFFDLRFALQVSYTLSDHDFNYRNTILGANETTATSFEVKYYTNTQNVTKGLGRFNPYFIGGFSQIYRTVDIDGAASSRDGSLGFNAGAGFEVPFARNSTYFGLEAKYTYVNFNDEGKLLSDGTTNTSFRLNGDLYTLYAILGVNF
tara:strand:- start:18060 stop:18734 length:675 start_codon:yes stop_codon:yes gene_type:complete